MGGKEREYRIQDTRDRMVGGEQWAERKGRRIESRRCGRFAEGTEKRRIEELGWRGKGRKGKSMKDEE
ncbi:MAG: hypothetical protein ABIH23_03370 [bacterium]